MSRNWSLAIVVAFVIGYSLKVYLDKQAEIATAQQQAIAEQVAAQALKDPVFSGDAGKEIHIFSAEDQRIRVVYFGYTRCADVCPTSLAMLSFALSSISPEQLTRLRPLFISIDPERDDGHSAHQFAQYFHPSIEGLSAPLAITQPVADHYGVTFRKTELAGSAIDYVVDHSSYFYFLKPNGELITQVPHTLDPAPIVSAIEAILDPEPTQ